MPISGGRAAFCPPYYTTKINGKVILNASITLIGEDFHVDLFRKKEINAVIERDKEFRQCLTAFDLTFLGIGAIIGAGIFVLSGVVAATTAGPAIILSYILAGLACAFSALSYAELAAMIGGCGSAYGYAYAGFGEIIAWIVGWDLLLEYIIAVSAVAVGWGSYFNDILLSLKINFPIALLHGPSSGGFLNIIPVFIVTILSALLILGIKSSVRFNNLMVIIKLSIIGLFIVIAVGEFETKNWVPFLPFGWLGVVKGASLIFFSYVGVDAISTASEEAINPQRDIPIGLISALIICTILYIVVSGLLTGIVPYTQLDVASPISNSLLKLGYKMAASVIGIGAIAGITTVMLVLFFGLSRVFYAMARDGLLPQYFAVTNQKTKTPTRIIVICGVLIAITASLIPLEGLAELVNIGTLFAFIIVCAGVIILRYRRPDLIRPFKTPFMPYIPIMGIICCLYLIVNLPWITLLRFVIWMFIGGIIYFKFSRHNSVLSNEQKINLQIHR